MNQEINMNKEEIGLFEEKIFEGLNQQQKLAIIKNDFPLRIIAGAGSGKTGVLTKKISYLIKRIKIKPERILALTFTNKASNEMKNRVLEIIGDEALKVNISTFHSLCSKFLRLEIKVLDYPQNFIVLDSSDQIYILKRIYKELDLSSSILSFSSMLEFISKLKMKSITPDMVAIGEEGDTELIKIDIYRKYLKEIESKKCVDFDDLLILTDKILTQYPDIRGKWSKKYDHILIDEFQDTASIQYDIIKNLSNLKNITIVGDPDQTIYSWRGANIDLINNFDKDFKDSTTITMDVNYRSTKNILDAANKLIRYNEDRLPKTLKTNSDAGSPIEFHYAYSQESEARWVVSQINELKRNKVQLKDIAIFYRSNFYSRLIESSLIVDSINHKIFGGKKFFENPEIKDVLSFLWVISKTNSQIHFQRIINVPSRKIGPATEAKLVKFSEDKKMPLYDALVENFKILPVSQEIKSKIVLFLNEIRRHKSFISRGIPIHQTIESFLNSIGYLSAIKEDNTEVNSKLENINELIKSIENWENKNKNLQLEDYLEEISLMNMSSDSEEDAINYVTLMTIHASKGLEFKNVFLLGLNEDIFPSARIMQIEDEHEQKEKMEEERRLAYVAITRAKEKLFVSGARGTNFIANITKQKYPSRFIAEMGIDISTHVSDLTAIRNFNNDIKINKNYIIGDTISHITFGEGVVLEIESDKITIKFKKDDIGIKQFLKNHKSIERIN
ncbi:MAG: exodeoxyribonuclease V subunit gamma [Mycoplasmataceae bacterium]|nr:exodeoxyribonuclease V subunit gamma [Mycoplasmataceae bacterium]